MQKQRLILLDILKGLAILCVVFFHANLFTYGYLGVDVFLVIAGFLTTKSIVKQYDNGAFCYLSFLKSRVIRLLPLVIIVSVVSFGLGYYTMLPTNYKNVAETALGSIFFLNNFIQYVTAGDYWDASNEYKPLMHTWYISLVFQFYIVFPLLFMFAHKVSKNWKRLVFYMLLVIGSGSLILYMLPIFTIAFHFYLLPSRLFEFIAGGLLFLLSSIEINKQKWQICCCLFLIILLMVFNANIGAEQYRLLLIVSITCLILWNSIVKEQSEILPNFKILSLLGMASYSIYLWHQVIIAFYRNIFNDDLKVWEYIFVICISLIVGLISFYFIEQPISQCCKRNKNVIYILITCVVIMLPLNYFSFKVYKHEGVVKDMPELDTYINQPATWASLLYNDTVQRCDVNFPNNGRKNVLVVGDSYGRDWYNILKESNYADSINLSYHRNLDNVLDRRIKIADYIFLANHGDFNIYDAYIPRMAKKILYRVGDKRYFSSPCLIYNKRFNGDTYYEQKENITNDIANRNIKEQEIFGDRFVNMMDVVKDDFGQYRIFTPDHKLISHDGLHLSKAGARYYAKRLNISKLFNK